MKLFIYFVLAGILLYTASYGQPEPTHKTILKYHSKMKTTGIVLLSAGIVTLISGLAIGVSEGSFSYEYHSYGNGQVEESGTPMAGVAGVMVGVGTLATVGGVILTVFGQKKVNAYKKRLGLNIMPSGVRLCYYF
jgi:hypothetical protein